MMHQIRRGPEGGPTFETMLTEEPLELGAANLGYLTQRFQKALIGRAVPIVERSEQGDTVPSLIRQLWMPEPDLVALSQAIAERLTEAQRGNALEGVLVVATAMVDSDNVVLVAKVEHQEALRLEPVTNEAGHRIFEIERLRDLVFGDAARVFKVAVLSEGGSSQGVLAGDVVDDQNGNGFAAYFLGGFLGMKLREAPAVMTEAYLQAMSTAINRSALSAQTKAEVHSALVTELTSNKATVNPNEFFKNYVPEAAEVELRAVAAEVGVLNVEFKKDNTRIQRRLEKVNFVLSNGVRVLAPADEVGPDKAVSLHSDGNEDVVTVTGRIDSIGGFGQR